MNIDQLIALSKAVLYRKSKRKLVQIVLTLSSELKQRETNTKTEVAILEKKIDQQKERLKQQAADLTKWTKKEINATSNQPSSKQAEFHKKTSGTSEKPKSRRKRGHSGRKGAGNRPKLKLVPDITNVNPLSFCPDCQTDLTTQPVTENRIRIVEDIPPIPEKTVISKEVQERKWCPSCAKIIASVTDAALPRSDIGLRALCLMAYLWVVSAISLPGISALLNNFFRLRLSTAGISKMMIRVSTIMKPVYEEILDDVKGGTLIFADETGWRVKGALWWLWIFANKETAYYFPSRQRGSAVVEKILGTAFAGVLVTDAWCAYMKIICIKQTCMAHIMRKVRKFRDAYPQYYSIMCFYRKLRRILLDGERLQLNRKTLGEKVFLRRLNLLHGRLDKLLRWKNPNAILKEVIAKVTRQRKYILTFVEHDGVPSHNNFGEYIIKKGVLKRKVSGGSMSEAGVMAYAVLQSIAQTCLLRKISFLDFLGKSLLHYIRTGTPLLLSEYTSQHQSDEIQKEAA